MPLNATLPDYYVDNFCNLIGKAADGSYDFGTAQVLSTSECDLAQSDWEKFVKQYGGKYGIKQKGSEGSTQDQNKGGSSLFNLGSGGLFPWPGLGLFGKGNNSPGSNFKNILIIIALIIGALLLFKFLRNK